MNWSDIEKWHKTWTPWINNMDAVKSHYLKILNQLEQETTVVNP